MWNPMQSLQGLMSRKQKSLLDQLKTKAAAEGKTAYGKMEELAQGYVNDKPILRERNQESMQIREPAVQGSPLPTPAPSISPGAPGTLQFELEKTKAVIQAAYDLSDMLRPEEPAAPAQSETDQLVQTVLTSFIQAQATQKTGGASDLPQT